MSETSMNSLQTATHHLIEKFVERQKLPYEVIKKFRPYWVGLSDRRSNKEYISATGHGHWGQDNEWDYYLHGVGCKLTHKITGEVINWDASNLKHFDPYWFV